MKPTIIILDFFFVVIFQTILKIKTDRQQTSFAKCHPFVSVPIFMLMCLWPAFRCETNFGRQPHPYNCELYVECVWGRLFVRECPLADTSGRRLHFNPHGDGVCDWPRNVGCRPTAYTYTNIVRVNGRKWRRYILLPRISRLLYQNCWLFTPLSLMVSPRHDFLSTFVFWKIWSDFILKW